MTQAENSWERREARQLVLHPEIADQMNHVLIRIDERTKSYALVGFDDFACRKAHFAEFASTLLDVGPGQVEQPMAGAYRVLGHLHPAAIGDLPFDQIGHRVV